MTINKISHSAQVIQPQEGIVHLRRPLFDFLGKHPTLQVKVGEGVQGAVYKEETASTSLPQHVAIKMIHKGERPRLTERVPGDILALKFNKDNNFGHTLALEIEDPLSHGRFILDNDNYPEMAKEVMAREKEIKHEKESLRQERDPLVKEYNGKKQVRDRLQIEIEAACLPNFILSRQFKKLEDDMAKLNQAVIKLDEKEEQLENQRFTIVASIMECLEGQDLIETIIAHKIDGNVRSYSLQILKAIQLMHSKGVVHRDLKPDNMFIQNGLIKIIDFGSAKKIQTDPRMQTSSVGTNNYKAPEVLSDRPYDSKADIYSAGIILYTMAIDEFPFAHANESALLNMIASYGQDGTSFEDYSGHNQDTFNAISRTKYFLQELRQKDPKLAEVILGLTRAVPSHRMTLQDAIDILENP